ncbi:RNA-guided endonuclease TnpB family protein [Tissierella sp. P1]|uniref:RNA-guided endonuclease InsQ/TnpB family protein n=1 Tax=Tissierella sp. P1 TaxID=1280483 RepID=UPI0019133972|nr:RNA-guided endonuclease TnpB family protein [Tissierella sp. P1]
MCILSKNLYNVGLYNIRQYYFNNNKHLDYICKENENYKLLNSNISQQILKEVDSTMKSFFGLIKLAKLGQYNYKDIRLSKYLEKEGFFSIIIGQIRIKLNGILDIPMSPVFKRQYGKVSIKVPDNLLNKNIKEIRIIPKYRARYFEAQYCYEISESKEELDKNKALAIDLGLDNLCTCSTNQGDSFIIDGKRLKSINQWANKQNSKLQSIKDKISIKGTTKKQAILWRKRNNQVNDYINKTCSYIIKYCIDNDIGNIVIGYNKNIQKGINIGKKNNQNFVNLPIGDIANKLEYLSKRNNINYIKQEESYTSKSDFLANDDLPKLNQDNPKKHTSSGKRITRGQYKSS